METEEKKKRVSVPREVQKEKRSKADGITKKTPGERKKIIIEKTGKPSKKAPRSPTEWKRGVMQSKLLNKLREATLPGGECHKSGITCTKLSKCLQNDLAKGSVPVGSSSDKKNYSFSSDTVKSNLSFLEEFGKNTQLFSIQCKEEQTDKPYTQYHYVYSPVIPADVVRLMFEAYARVEGVSKESRFQFAHHIRALYSEQVRKNLYYEKGFPDQVPPDSNDENEPFKKILSKLYRAIDEQLTVSIVCGDYNTDKKLVGRINQKGMPVTVNVFPLRVVVYRGRCYLICRPLEENKLSFLRVDRICRLGINPRKKSSTTNDNNLLNESTRSHYSQRLFMSEGELHPITLQTDVSHINEVIDWFGRDLTFYPVGNNTVSVTVVATKEAMIRWALMYGDFITVTSPGEIVTAIRQRLQSIAGKYPAPTAEL